MSPKTKQWLLTVWIVVFTVVVLWNIHTIRGNRARTVLLVKESIYMNCTRTNKVLGDLIRPQIKALNHIQYYKDHPIDKQTALQEIRKSLRIVDIKVCNNLPTQANNLK